SGVHGGCPTAVRPCRTGRKGWRPEEYHQGNLQWTTATSAAPTSRLHPSLLLQVGVLAPLHNPERRLALSRSGRVEKPTLTRPKKRPFAGRTAEPGPAVSWQRLDLRRVARSEEHTSELQSRENLVCRLLLEKKKNTRH